MLTLAHLPNGQPCAQFAAGFGIGTTTVYRYIAEAVELLTALAPHARRAVRAASMTAYLILDGTILPIDWGHLPAEGWGRSPPTVPSTRASTRSKA